MSSWKDVKYGDIRHREVKPRQPARRSAPAEDSPALPPEAKRSKWGVDQSQAGRSKRTADGITFDSLKEMRRYLELKLLLKAGEISDLELQPCFVLHVVVQATGQPEKCGVYHADFKFKTKTGETVIEDAKSSATARDTSYRLRKRMCELEYGITIREV